MAAITSQGVPVGGCLWYFNYLAILVILLTCVALVISYLSTTASHSYCETIFLTIYTPASQLFNISVNIQGMHRAEDNGSNESSWLTMPTWFKQFLLILVLLATTHELSLMSALYAVCMTLIYTALSALVKRYNEVLNKQNSKASFTSKDYLCISALVLSVSADILIHPMIGVAQLTYFIFSDRNTVAVIKSTVEYQNIEIFEGLEQHYTDGLAHLAEVFFAIVSAFAQPSLSFVYIPFFYFCVYQPVLQFRAAVKKIKSESLCMSHFEKASASDISKYDDVCAVCLYAMKHARITPCKHMFHGKCLKACLKKKQQCPLCNKQML